MYKNEDMLEELVYETLVCLKINKLEGKWLYTVFCNKIKFLQGSSIFLKNDFHKKKTRNLYNFTSESNNVDFHRILLLSISSLLS